MQSQIPNIKQKGLFGVIYFLGNSTYSAILGLAANLAFTIFLKPAEYGLYFIVLSIMTIFGYFTDLGLAASLVQKKDPKEEEFFTAFTIQLALVTSVVLLGFLLTPLIIYFYHLSSEGIALYRAMLISLFVLSFKSIPSTRLERKLEYSKIVLTQAIESTFFNVVSVAFLFSNFGIYALAIGLVARSFVGTFFMYYFTRWKPKLLFSKEHARSILKFGIPFQSNVMLAFIKDDLLNLYLAARLGLTNFGYMAWGKKWAEAPLRIILDNTNRVLFPILSMFQDQKDKVAGMIEKNIFYNSLILMPVFAGSFFAMPIFVQAFPGYQKWEIAISSFSFFLLSSLFVSFITPCINVFNAIGKVKTSVGFMLLWIFLNWFTVPLLVTTYGFTGVSIAFAINSLSFILVLYELNKYVHFRFLRAVYHPLIATFYMVLMLWALSTVQFSPTLKLVATFALGAGTYIFVILSMTKGEFIKDIITILRTKEA
ncbi:MAG: oligosaccharide flippase family protein [Candidatus Roizmanbacteria bacterium]|nr:oligosaccharide flippase family protein [Candidatus Roizmanbacteria bacterium]